MISQESNMKKIFSVLFVMLLISCGGGGSSTPDASVSTTPSYPANGTKYGSE